MLGKKRVIVIILGVLSLLLVATVTADPQKMMGADFRDAVVLQGFINAGHQAVAAQIEILSKSPISTIKLVINSEGGSVIIANRIIAAMDLAKARGKPITCLVPSQAQSMAMYIFAKCNQRFALRHSMLMFHHVYLAAIKDINRHDAQLMLAQLTATEEGSDVDFAKELGTDMTELNPYFEAEVEWPVEVFMRKFPAFKILLVDDIKLPNDVAAFPMPLPSTPPQ